MVFLRWTSFYQCGLFKGGRTLNRVVFFNVYEPQQEGDGGVGAFQRRLISYKEIFLKMDALSSEGVSKGGWSYISAVSLNLGCPSSVESL